MISQTPRRHTARMDKGAGDVGHRIAIDQQQVGTCSRCDTPSVGESEALLTIWEGKKKRALDHLQEAAALAEEIGLPAEQWQIRMLLGNLYEAEGEYAQAGTAFGNAVALARAGTGRRHQGRGPPCALSRRATDLTLCCSTRTGVTP